MSIALGIEYWGFCELSNIQSGLHPLHHLADICPGASRRHCRVDSCSLSLCWGLGEVDEVQSIQSQRGCFMSWEPCSLSMNSFQFWQECLISTMTTSRTIAQMKKGQGFLLQTIGPNMLRVVGTSKDLARKIIFRFWLWSKPFRHIDINFCMCKAQTRRSRLAEVSSEQKCMWANKSQACLADFVQCQ